MNTGQELTICPVYYSYLSLKSIEMNYALTEKLNSGNNWTWLVGDNTPPGFSDKPKGEKIAVVRGFDQTNPDDLGDYFIKGISPKKKIYSYWHGATLNKMLKEVKTRYLLVLDNNFLIVRRNWVNECLDHMKKNDLGFFGATNPPGKFQKYRNFPEVHCMFIDLEKTGKEIDFMPFFESKTKKSRLAKALFKKHLSVGVSRDVGFRIFHKFAKSGVKSDHVQPVYKDPPGVLRRISDIFFPEQYRLYPKKNYYATQSFLSAGRVAYGDKNFEEYVWKGKPFGFHLRGAAYGGKSKEFHDEVLRFIDVELNNLI